MHREHAFTDANWAFELPSSGHRVLAEFGGAHLHLWTQRGTDVASWFPEVGQALSALHLHALTVIDGELSIPDEFGRNDLARWKERALVKGHCPGSPPVVFCMRDLLFLQGQDVRPLRWQERRALLKSISDVHPGLPLHRIVAAEGEWLYRQAMALQRPAIHAHRIDAPYVAGRSRDWLVIDCAQRAEVPASHPGAPR